MNATIEYDHNRNSHLPISAEILLRLIIEQCPAYSLVDVGCGTGTWLKAAQHAGIKDLLGLDGIEVSPASFLAPGAPFLRQNFTAPWNLGRRFDLCLCLEVAEHLPPESSRSLVENLGNCSDQIAFSAAIPGQPGQAHINCRWPAYWQHLFNQIGYSCEDTLRERIWDDSRIEPWYRQNLFLAKKSPKAGREPRLRALVHPEILECACMVSRTQGEQDGRQLENAFIRKGGLRCSDYLVMTGRVLADRLRCKLTGPNSSR